MKAKNECEHRNGAWRPREALERITFGEKKTFSEEGLYVNFS